MNLLGLLFHMDYRLHRHFWLGLGMDTALILACLLGSIVAYLQAAIPCAAALGFCGAGLVALALGARRAGYVIFQRTIDRVPTPSEPLRLDSELQVRASGLFRVGDGVRYLANHPTGYSTARSREHILMAGLRHSRLLLVGSSPPGDWGWWYIFIKPDEIDLVEPGRLYWEWRPSPALRISHRFTNVKGEEEPATTFLSFPSPEQRARVWSDLTLEERELATTR